MFSVTVALRCCYHFECITHKIELTLVHVKNKDLLSKDASSKHKSVLHISCVGTERCALLSVYIGRHAGISFVSVHQLFC